MANFLEKVKGFFCKVGAAIKGVWDKVTPPIVKVWKIVSGAVVNAYKKCIGAIKSVWGKFIAWFKEVTKDVNWKEVWDKCTTGLLIFLMASPILILGYIFLWFVFR